MSKRSTVVYLLVRKRTVGGYIDNSHVIRVSQKPPKSAPSGTAVVPLRLTIDDEWFVRRTATVNLEAGPAPEQPTGEVA